jgi:ferredoxin-NADP reductase
MTAPRTCPECNAQIPPDPGASPSRPGLLGTSVSARYLPRLSASRYRACGGHEMPERKTGTVVDKELLSDTLMRFRLMPEEGAPFPEYEAGQHIALRRDDCKLTRRLGAGMDGKQRYEPDLDPWGRPLVGTVTHAYSIASAPAETSEHGWLEFLVTLEHGVHGLPGRLSEALFGVGEGGAAPEVGYVDRIAGNFTLAARGGDAQSVLLVGTGAGVAPFAALVKQLHAEASLEDTRRYTLVHTHRTVQELAFRDLFFEIEASGSFDFMYVPTISRPAQEATVDPRIGQGRATNVVRHLYELPMAEEEKQTRARSDVSVVAAGLAMERLVHPVLPRHLNADELRRRHEPADTVLMTCGNPTSMADLRATCDQRQIRFEIEAW